MDAPTRPSALAARLAGAAPGGALGVALALASLLIGARPARADRSFSVILKGGVSIATWYGDLPTDPLFANGSRVGVGAGVGFSFGLTRLIAVQPELLYVEKGTSLGDVTLTDAYGASTGTAHDVLAVDYIELPVLARIALPHARQAAPYLIVGPALGMRGAQRQKVSGDVHLSQAIRFVKDTDVGVAFGIGTEVGSGPRRFEAEARYTLGLTQATEPSYSTNARNGALLLLLGVAIHP
ncbi:MAG: PorT family protein [Candidatus Eisenbacteria bacterium]|nr:PorT family protein [Candidatus Eisenbacteria bacterium]